MSKLKTVNIKKKSGFPEKLLRKWLIGRIAWNHTDWLELLDELRDKGYAAFADVEEGRTEIGQFLEAERERI
ncbi:MAG: hypothetical protein M1561_03455 [Gammaproteobacteria bacterium]|nr:hypothetical protein [Gammaproteobacteria bacterium]